MCSSDLAVVLLAIAAGAAINRAVDAPDVPLIMRVGTYSMAAGAAIGAVATGVWLALFFDPTKEPPAPQKKAAPKPVSRA